MGTVSRATSDVVWSRPIEAVRLLLRGRTARTALPVAAVVGTVLSSVNQGTTLAAGDVAGATWARVAVNYMVPFLVSSWGFLSARRVPATSLPLSEPEHGGASDTARLPR